MRTAVRALLVAIVALCSMASPCLAADEAHGAAAHDDPSSKLIVPELYVAVATVVVFLLLLLILTKTAWKPILTGLQAREKGIRDAIEGAEKANADAKAMLADYQAKVSSANDEARKIVEEGRRDAEALKSKIHADAQAEAGRERDRALRDIEIARQGALKDIYDQVAAVATEVAGRILKTQLDPAGHRRLVDESVVAYESSRKASGAASSRSRA